MRETNISWLVMVARWDSLPNLFTDVKINAACALVAGDMKLFEAKIAHERLIYGTFHLLSLTYVRINCNL